MNRIGAHLLTSFTLMVVLLPSVQAREVIGYVLNSQNMPAYPAGKKLYEQAEIHTRGNQRLAIKTQQGDVLVAAKNARIKLVKPGFFSQLFGRIYYFISPRKNNQLQINTAVATIGIRGTKFIVDSDEKDLQKQNVSLLEGELQLDARDGTAFALYQQREMDEFERYKKQIMGEFDAYKQQMMEQFVAYQTELRLEAGHVLQFDGKKAIRKPMSESLVREFEEFEHFANADRWPQAGE